MIDLSKIKVGDEIYIDGDSGFCTPHYVIIKSIDVELDPRTMQEFTSITMSDGHKFDSRTGRAMNPPTAYFIRLD